MCPRTSSFDYKLRVIGLTTFRGRCACCGEVRSTHPLQVSTAVGAAGVHLGPNALSMTAQLQHRWHLSKRRSCDLLKELFGLFLTPGGLVEATHRLATKPAPEHKALQEEVRHCEVLYSDETSWYVGAPGHTLWDFTNPQLTLYCIVAHRTRSNCNKSSERTFSAFSSATASPFMTKPLRFSKSVTPTTSRPSQEPSTPIPETGKASSTR